MRLQQIYRVNFIFNEKLKFTVAIHRLSALMDGGVVVVTVAAARLWYTYIIYPNQDVQCKATFQYLLDKMKIE